MVTRTTVARLDRRRRGSDDLQVVDAVQRFTALVGESDPELDRGALAIAAGADPELAEPRWLAELDRLAEGVGSLDALRHRLFVEEGFAGNTERYYDPRNSLLDRVLHRRLGIPITLSVVAIEVGRRAGVPLEGVGMPGHFLLRTPGTQDYLDAFEGGAPLDLAGCEARFRASTGAGAEVAFGPHLLGPAPVRHILVRILENLRAVYRRSARASDVEWVLRMRLALPGAGAAEMLELGSAMGQQGRWIEGATLLESRAPEFPRHTAALTYAARGLRAHLN